MPQVLQKENNSAVKRPPDRSLIAPAESFAVVDLHYRAVSRRFPFFSSRRDRTSSFAEEKGPRIRPF